MLCVGVTRQETPVTADELAGVVVGDSLQLVRPLGRAPQAWVWEAQDHLGRPGAERVAAWLVPVAAETVAPRVAELTAWTGTEHAYLLSYRTVIAAEHGDEHYVVLVTDPVDGSLRDRLDTGRRLSLSEASDLGTALSSALVTLHRGGQVHGAVVPEHIWWDGRQWRLGGLGLGGPGTAADDVAAIAQILSAALSGPPSAAPVPLTAPWRALLQACAQRQVTAEWVLRELTDPDSPLRQNAPPPPPRRPVMDTTPAPPARQVAVSVCLIALLALIALAPAVLHKHRHNRTVARQSTCLSNLKQIGLATLMYSQDWDGCLPAPVVGGGQDATAQLLPYTHNPGVHHCPAQRPAAQSYFYCAPQPLRLSAIPAPSLLGLHGEGRSLSAPVFAHNNGAGVAYADGHVKWIPAPNYLRPEVTQWRQATMPLPWPSPRVMRPGAGKAPSRTRTMPPQPPR